MGKEAKRSRDRNPDAVNQAHTMKRAALRMLSAEELACRTQQGCERSFEELVERYSVRLYQFLLHRTQSVQDAEDLVQETFVKAYRNICRYRNSCKFSTWLFTIAKRLASSHFRGLSHSQRIVQNKSESPGPGDLMAEQEERQHLWAAARDLPMGQYQALWLRYAEDMSIKEIAKVLRKSQVGVKVLLYRARIKLGRRLVNMAAKDEETGKIPSKETLSYMKVEGA